MADPAGDTTVLLILKAENDYTKEKLLMANNTRRQKVVRDSNGDVTLYVVTTKPLRDPVKGFILGAKLAEVDCYIGTESTGFSRNALAIQFFPGEMQLVCLNVTSTNGVTVDYDGWLARRTVGKVLLFRERPASVSVAGFHDTFAVRIEFPPQNNSVQRATYQRQYLRRVPHFQLILLGFDLHTSQQTRHAPHVVSMEDEVRHLLEEQIGGNSNKVFRVRDLSTGEEVAGKRYTSSGRSRHKLLKSLDHENIAKFVDELFSPRGDWLFLEYATHLSLYDTKDTLEITGELVLAIETQVMKAAHHAHRTSIIHSDIRPSKCLITSLSPIAIKVTGWDDAQRASNAGKLLKKGKRSLYFAAPEIYDDGWDKAVDIYGAGMTGLYMFGVVDDNGSAGDPRKQECRNPMTAAQAYMKRVLAAEMPNLKDHSCVNSFVRTMGCPLKVQLTSLICHCMVQKDRNLRLPTTSLLHQFEKMRIGAKSLDRPRPTTNLTGITPFSTSNPAYIQQLLQAGNGPQPPLAGLAGSLRGQATSGIQPHRQAMHSYDQARRGTLDHGSTLPQYKTSPSPQQDQKGVSQFASSSHPSHAATPDNSPPPHQDRRKTSTSEYHSNIPHTVGLGDHVKMENTATSQFLNSTTYWDSLYDTLAATPQLLGPPQSQPGALEASLEAQLTSWLGPSAQSVPLRQPSQLGKRAHDGVDYDDTETKRVPKRDNNPRYGPK